MNKYKVHHFFVIVVKFLKIVYNNYRCKSICGDYMVTIKIGRKKVKIFNLILLISFLLVLIYIISSLVFLLPFFNTKYDYKIKKENYSISASAAFRKSVFNCNLKEEYIIDVKDKDIKQKIYKDLLSDGFKNKKENIFVKKSKNFGLCKDDIKEYKKIHNDNYATFKLNGNSNIDVEYGSAYNEEYVSASIDDNNTNDISIDSNLNIKKLGKYIITYKLNIDKNYNQRLYKIVNIIDKQSPVITLIGDKEIVLNYGDKYSEAGYTIVDNYDGDITKKVNVKEKIDTKKPGNYKVTYSVKDSSGNSSKEERIVIVKEKEEKVVKEEPIINKPIIDQKNGITYINGILLVNKTYGLPKDYDPKVNKEASDALKLMQKDASVLGLNLPLISGYRSYKKQSELYKNYVKIDGEEKANTYSAKPGHSEHQTGLAFDIGKVDDSFKGTMEAKWIEENAHLYGFIVRYPKDKTNITGYIYEPWHVRYLGIDIATKVKESNLSLEEYLGLVN